jgi:hypothetical protein
MGNRTRILLFAAVLAIALSAREVLLANKAGAVAQAPCERDKGKEDQVAKQFETIRSDLNRPRLTRIDHRDSLEQTVCTIALTDTPPKYTSTDISGFYKTAQPESVSAELKKVASFSTFHPKSNLGFTRYSVAVWRMEDSLTGEATYWVGVHLYESGASEFFDDHFTDDIEYHNDWKKSVAPQCRGK